MERVGDLPAEYVMLCVNVVLVGVTAWYAYLTRKLAKSSERAAVAAEKSAYAAERAAEHSASAVDLQRRALVSQAALAVVTFKVRRRYSRTGHLEGLDLSVKGKQSPVIHDVQFSHAVPAPRSADGRERDLTLALPRQEWPVRLAPGTALRLTFTEEMSRTHLSGLVHLAINITYSLDGESKLTYRVAMTDLLVFPLVPFVDFCRSGSTAKTGSSVPDAGAGRQTQG